MTITKKNPRDSKYKIISIRMKEDLFDKLEAISGKTNRSRNDVVNILLTEAAERALIEED